MRIVIKTSVNQNKEQVAVGFTEGLFLKLSPPFPKVSLVRFDGCRQGDQVEISLNFLIFKQTWISEVTSNSNNQIEWEFVDEGKKLPFPLKFWKHHHRVIQESVGSTIIDDIIYKSPNLMMDLMLYPLLYLQFLYRRPVYRKIFS